ncbi:unnamed protein product [Closterium sp. Yama58-4]|nr:unnamed protein product [Closterium sp. Yama58-4]
MLQPQGREKAPQMGKGEEKRDGYQDPKRRRGGESREEVEGRLRECLKERRLWHLLEDRSPLLASLKAHVKLLWKMGQQAVQERRLWHLLEDRSPLLASLKAHVKLLWKMGQQAVQVRRGECDMCGESRVSREEVEGRLRECLKERRLWHLLEDRSPLLASLKAHVKTLWKMGHEAVQGREKAPQMGKGEEKRDGYQDPKRRRGGESREEVEGRLRECLKERRLWHLLEDRSPLLASLKAHVKLLWKMGQQAVQERRLWHLLEDRSPLLASLKAHVKLLWKMGQQAVQPFQDALLAHEPTLEDLQGEKKGALQLFALLLGAPEVTSLRKDELAELKGSSQVPSPAPHPLGGEQLETLVPATSAPPSGEQLKLVPTPSPPPSTSQGGQLGGLLLPQEVGLSDLGDERIARVHRLAQLNRPPPQLPTPSPPALKGGQLGGVLLPQEVGLSDIGDERIARLNRPPDVLLTEFLERRLRWEHTEERELLAAKLEAYIRSLIRTNPEALKGYQELFFARCAGAEEDVQQEKRDVVRVVALLLGCSVPAQAKKLQLQHQPLMAGPVVLVTGCSSGGIGSELCKAFAAKGCRVFASARRPDSMQDLAGLGIETVQLDVTSPASIQEAVSTVISKAGRIDILVNNAGAGCFGPMAEMPLDAFRSNMETNVVGLLAVTQAVVPHMVEQGSGKVINIGSVSAWITTPFAGTYCAAKAAVHSITHALRMELKPFGIQVMLVAPGAIRSNFGGNSSSSVSHLRLKIFSRFQKQIEARAGASQTPQSTPGDVFARALVEICVPAFSATDRG